MTIPSQTTRFIGREQELAEIASLLDDPACRLLTLVGPGGSGKTRLALEFARQCAERYGNEWYFVPLQAVTRRDTAISAAIEALGHHLYGQEEPATQLLTFLSGKQALLILDNFEHLLDLGDLITRILEAAPGIVLLVTSRETLNLREEWLFSVHGMDIPARPDTNVTDFSAVQLFLEHARRVRRDFTVADEREHIVQICRSVDGMPLAIELAASWLRVLSCSEIAAEIQHNLDFLETTWSNIPERHRSMRAVIDQSWKLLNDAESITFKQMSVFNGSFDRDAAVEIAGATLPVLATLIDKSLVQPLPDGRYQIHQLLRQYGSEKLQENSEDVTLTSTRHCNYYATFAHQRYLPLLGSRQREAVQEIAVEIENIQTACQYAVDNDLMDPIEKLVHTYYLFCDLTSRYQEPIAALELAVDRLKALPVSSERNALLVMWFSYLGWEYIRVGRFDDSEAAFGHSLELLEQSNSAPPPAFGTDPLGGLCLLMGTIGNYREAIKYGEESRRQCDAAGDRLNLQVALYALAATTLSLGDYESASTYADQAITFTREQDHQWMTAYILIILGDIARAQGEFGRARQHYQESYALKEGLDDPEGMAVALNHLGEVALRQSDYEEATRLFERSLAIYERIYDRGGLATTLKGAANAATGAGNKLVAYQCFSRALQTAVDIQYLPLILAILADIGEVLLVAHRARAVELMTLALCHNASEFETREQARNALKKEGVTQTSDATYLPDSTVNDLIPVIGALQTELEALALSEESSLARQIHRVPEHQHLIESLTPREQEVLGLLAKGYSNGQIANQMVIAVGTVKTYVYTICQKLAADNRTHAVVRAREFGLLE